MDKQTILINKDGSFALYEGAKEIVMPMLESGAWKQNERNWKRLLIGYLDTSKKIFVVVTQ